MIIVAVFGGGCRKPEPPGADLSVYFTCDTHGRLEPCGCFIGQYGGLTRLKTALDHEDSTNNLRLDVGDAAAGREDYDFVEFGYMLRGFAAMKFDALNIGAREAQFSADQLRPLKQTSPVPILSANLVDAKSRQPLFDSYRVLQRGAYRIGIIGVVDPRTMERPGDGLAITDMNSSIERCLGELRGKADYIVLLAFTDEATLTQLAQQFYECNIILGGKVRQSSQQLQTENRSLIYFVTNEGRTLGILRVRLQKNTPLMATANEVRLLDDQIPQDAALQTLMHLYREEIRGKKLAVDDPNNLAAGDVPGVRRAAAFVGTEKCVTCHRTAGVAWSSSAHSQAFATLQHRDAAADPKCIGCHTIGFGDASGYQRAFNGEKLVNVGCESCHGHGSLHVRQKEGDAAIDFTFRPLDAGDCAKCHFGEFSRPFKWETFWPVIQHGKEPRPTASSL